MFFVFACTRNLHLSRFALKVDSYVHIKPSGKVARVKSEEFPRSEGLVSFTAPTHPISLQQHRCTDNTFVPTQPDDTKVFIFCYRMH